MENNPYERTKKSKTELYQEKLQKRNETQDWIFGNSFGKPGSGAPLRDNQGNVITHLKTIDNENIFIYDAEDFTRGNSDISVINHRIFDKYNNQINLNNNINSNNNLILNNYQLQSKALNQIENNKNNNLLIQNNNIQNIPKVNYSYQYLPNIPYNLVLPNNINNIQSINNGYFQNLYSNNNFTQKIPSNNGFINNNIYQNRYSQNNLMRNSSNSFFGIDSKKREEQKSLEIQEYRNELLLQIQQKKIRDEERKRKMEEEDRIEDYKNKEYYKIKKQQADEQKRKLKEKIMRRMQGSYEDYGSSSNIFEMSNDFENVNNNSFKRTSFFNNNDNNEENLNEENNENNFINNENNLYGEDMLLEQDDYMNKIDNDYQIFRKSLNDDIDKQINKNNDNMNHKIINNDINNKGRIHILNKQNQLADYIIGNTFSPPTPIKYNKIINNNPLSNSYSQKTKNRTQNFEILQNNNIYKNHMYNSFKNKEINLEDFFNRDENKYDYNEFNPKDAIRTKEAHDKVDQDYNSIFKDLINTHSYTKKYSKKKEKDNAENFSTSSSFFSKINDEKEKNNNKSQQKYYTGYKGDQPSTIQTNQKKSNKEVNSEKEIMVDEHSVRTTGIKSFNKTVLDKELRNIQENKEDEEDEEEDKNNNEDEDEEKNNKENDKEKEEEEEEEEEEVEGEEKED